MSIFKPLSKQELYCNLQASGLAFLDLATDYKGSSVNNPASIACQVTCSVSAFIDVAESAFVAFAAPRFITVALGATTKFEASLLKNCGLNKNFWLFPSLPKELQAEVWKVVEYDLEARTITITEQWSPDGPGVPIGETESNGYLNSVVTGAGTPAVFQFPGARDFIVRKGIYHPMFEVTGSRKAVYFNPDIDNVKLDSVHADPKINFGQVLEHPVEVDEVKNLRVNAALLDEGGANNWFVSNVGAMRGLRALRVEGTFSGAKDGSGRDTEFSFVMVAGPKFSPRVLSEDGTLLHGSSALHRLFKSIADRDEQQRVMDVWMTLDKAVARIDNLPQVVDCFFRYVRRCR